MNRLGMVAMDPGDSRINISLSTSLRAPGSMLDIAAGPPPNAGEAEMLGFFEAFGDGFLLVDEAWTIVSANAPARALE